MRKNKMLEFAEQVRAPKVVKKIYESYSEDVRMILAHREDLVIKKYPEVYKKLASNGYKMDTREWYEYAEDIAVNWVKEDYVKVMLQAALGTRVYNNGSDAKREFLGNWYITQDTDLVMDYFGEDIFVEVVCDRTRYNGKIFLRDKKLLNLQKQSRNNKVMIFYMNTQNNTFSLIDVSTVRGVKSKKFTKEGYDIYFDIDGNAKRKSDIVDVFENIARL